MDDLIEGYRRFRAGRWPRERERFENLASKGQKPRTLLIACSDSRVDPQSIFDAGPGELFVIRNVANLVPAYSPDGTLHGTSAAIEFAVRSLEVERVVVMGHARCGGILSLMADDPSPSDDFVSRWTAIAAPARSRVLRAEGLDAEQRQERCEHEAIRVSLDNLVSFPWIRERVADGRLKLHGAYFAVFTGKLLWLDATDTFAPVAPPPDAPPA